MHCNRTGSHMYVDLCWLGLYAVCRGLSEVLGVGNALKHCTYVRMCGHPKRTCSGCYV